MSFAELRKGLLKKAHELAVLCDVDGGGIVFSERGKMFQYPEPPASLTDLIRRYEAVNNSQLLQQTHCTDHQQMIAEIGRLRHEYERLEASLRTYTVEELSSVASVDDLDELELQIESAVSKVRARKDELQVNLTDDMQPPPPSYVLKKAAMAKLILAIVAVATLAMPVHCAAGMGIEVTAVAKAAVTAPAPVPAPAPANSNDLPNILYTPTTAHKAIFAAPDEGASNGNKIRHALIVVGVIAGCWGSIILVAYLFVTWRDWRQRRVIQHTRGPSIAKIAVATYDAEAGECECDICMEEYVQGDQVGILPCTHRYHDACIRRWLADGASATCPRCKEVV